MSNPVNNSFLTRIIGANNQADDFAEEERARPHGAGCGVILRRDSVPAEHQGGAPQTDINNQISIARVAVHQDRLQGPRCGANNMLMRLNLRIVDYHRSRVSAPGARNLPSLAAAIGCHHTRRTAADE